MSPDQISGSPQPRLSASICLFQRVIASVMYAPTSLLCANLILPRYQTLRLRKKISSNFIVVAVVVVFFFVLRIFKMLILLMVTIN